MDGTGASRESPGIGGGRTVLAADDNDTNRMVIQHMLASLGFSALIARDGVEALEILESPKGRAVEAVLMDCHMPLLDGFDTTRFIRARERDLGLPRCPIIAVTASVGRADEDSAKAAGMDDFVTKPVSRQVLAETLTRWLDPETGNAGSPPSTRPPLETGQDELASIGGVALLDQVRALYLADALERARDLGVALERNDAPAMAALAHALKGASLSVGATDVARPAGALEHLCRSGLTTGAEALVGAILRALACGGSPTP